MLKKKLFIRGLATTVILMSMTAVPINVFAADSINDQKTEEKMSFEIRDTNDLYILSKELDRFVAQYPNSTYKDQEQHIISFMQNGSLNRVYFRSIGYYISGYNKLNFAE